MKKLLYVLASALIICTFVFFAAASSSDAETSTDGEGEETNKQEDAVKEMPTYKIGETVTVKTSSGEYTVKISGVKETADRNEFSDVKADRVILVSYEYENKSYNDDLYVSESNMKVYDKENNLLESYPSTEQKYASSVGTGRKSNGVAAYALNSDSNYAEIEFYDNMFNSSADCKFILEW